MLVEPESRVSDRAGHLPPSLEGQSGGTLVIRQRDLLDILHSLEL